MQCPFCGKTKSKRKKEFTDKTLQEHIASAHQDSDLDFPLTDLIADDDMPDGAYFALAWELGEL